jgi:hypothetical protein
MPAPHDDMYIHTYYRDSEGNASAPRDDPLILAHLLDEAHDRFAWTRHAVISVCLVSDLKALEYYTVLAPLIHTYIHTYIPLVN